MRLLPQSLFGRLVMVLLAGLVLAELATAYINLAERDQLLYRASGMQLAQRIADIGKLLDSLPSGERRRIVSVFDAPPLTISLDRPPIAAADPPSKTDIPLNMFTTVLRYQLGDEMRANVVRREGAPPPGFRTRGRFAAPPDMPDMADMPMMGHRMGGGFGRQDFASDSAFFTVQVTLRDGTRVTFDTFLPPQATPIPVRLALTLAILLGTVIVLSLVAVRWVTGPLSALATAADKLGADINRPPLPESGPAEVRNAARAFNTMQRRLARFIADRTRILAAMSHDLKTPITRMRLRTEMLDNEEVRGKFAKDLEEMEMMVAHTLDFMRDASAVDWAVDAVGSALGLAAWWLMTWLAGTRRTLS